LDSGTAGRGTHSPASSCSLPCWCPQPSPDAAAPARRSSPPWTIRRWSWMIGRFRRPKSRSSIRRWWQGCTTNAEQLETLYGLLAINNDYMVAEKYFHGQSVDQLSSRASVTKSITSARVGSRWSRAAWRTNISISEEMDESDCTHRIRAAG
jgi:hypothetical protein